MVYLILCAGMGSNRVISVNLPDLVVRTCKITPEKIYSTDIIEVDIEIMNQGSDTVKLNNNSFFTINISETGQTATMQTAIATCTIGPGKNFPWKIVMGTRTAGTHKLTIILDPHHRIIESNEDNNTYTADLTVAQGGADLYFSQITDFVDLSNPNPQISIIVTNKGSLPANFSGVWLDSPELGILSCPFSMSSFKYECQWLDPQSKTKIGSPYIGNFKSETFNVGIPVKTAGVYKYTFRIDPKDSFREPDETDNIKKVWIIANYSSGELPDLIVTKCSFTKRKANDSFHIQRNDKEVFILAVEIKNNGKGYAIFPAGSTLWSAEGAFKRTQEPIAIAPGETYSSSALYNNPPSGADTVNGKKTEKKPGKSKTQGIKTDQKTISPNNEVNSARRNITVMVDPEKVIKESDDNNNSKLFKFN